MAKYVKLVALLVLCAVFAAAEATPASDDFRKCYITCHAACKAGGDSFTFCEHKCEARCSANMTPGKSKSQKH